jgi:hypothetical protein
MATEKIKLNVREALEAVYQDLGKWDVPPERPKPASIGSRVK